jgi:hypothetical protein
VVFGFFADGEPSCIATGLQRSRRLKTGTTGCLALANLNEARDETANPCSSHSGSTEFFVGGFQKYIEPDTVHMFQDLY